MSRKLDLPPVDSPEGAVAFLTYLHQQGLMYHPEDNAYDCLWGDYNLDYETLGDINDGMTACFTHLSDPCEVALTIINGE
jgi:hypothetical protein